MFTSASILLAIASLTPALAQSSCNPLQGSCPPDVALGKAVFYDFTKGSSSDWSLSTGAFPTFNSSGAQFSIVKHLDSPTMSSNWYMMFGHYDIVAQIAPGQGAVSSSVLMSDTHDEVDLEWVGNQENSLQCNYFGKGQEGSEQTVTVSSPSSTFHTYTIDWTSSALTWIVDGKTVRSIPSSSPKYPQTPMQLKIGTWPGGDPSEAAGTIAWAGGPINYNDGPFTMTVKSVTVWDYSTGTSYAYSGTSGTMGSISSNGGKIGQFSNINGISVSTAAMTGSSTSTSATSISTPISSSTTSSSSAVATTISAIVTSSTPSSSSASASSSAPQGTTTTPGSLPGPSSFTTIVQTLTTPETGTGTGTAGPSTVSTVVPVGSTPSPSGPSPGSGTGSGSGSGSGSGTGTGSGSGSGTGTSQIPAPIQSEIAAIGKKNPFLGQLLEGIWSWIANMMSRSKQRW